MSSLRPSWIKNNSPDRGTDHQRL